MTILVTGAAGFIGFHLTKRLISRKIDVVAIDNINSYYDINLKKSRIKILKELSDIYNKNFRLFNDNLENQKSLQHVFDKYNPTKVVNLAAQAGTRHSIENPAAYIQSNLVGFANILECCRHSSVEQLLYASSSSVYGGNTKLPFKESDSVDHPVSLYAATKKSNELMAHSYSHLYNLPTTGLRFFTVYGPWGRPDMALFLFTKAIQDGLKIKIFNNGNMIRDFTYIDDIVESIVRLLDKPARPDKLFDSSKPNSSTSWAPYKIFNIGNSQPIELMEYIVEIENALGKKANKEFLPMQPGDVAQTSADTNALEQWIGFKPETSISKGINQFINWYQSYYEN